MSAPPPSSPSDPLDDEDGESPLNDPALTDGLVDALLRTLPDGARVNELARCTREALLATWSASEDLEDRVAVAFNPSTPTDALARLAVDAEPQVRAQVAFNPRADAASLQRLFDDPSPFVHEAVELAFETELGHELRKGGRVFGLAEPHED